MWTWVVVGVMALLAGCPASPNDAAPPAPDASGLLSGDPRDPRCTVCPSPWGVPSPGCTDVRLDPANCGACDVMCPSGVCSRGSCVTPTCDLTCEGTAVCCGASCTNPNRDVANCGSCGQACLPGQSCELGACACDEPKVMCADACLYVNADPANCGACGHACAPEEPYCYASTCHECTAGSLNCGAGCMYVWGDAQNCGACGHVCSGPGLSGQCFGETCATCAMVGLADCSGACVAVQWSHESCGACDHACGPTEQCVLGACVGSNSDCGGTCPTNTACCDGVCTDLRSDWRACGQCGVGCPTGYSCTNARCEPPEDGD